VTAVQLGSQRLISFQVWRSRFKAKRSYCKPYMYTKAVHDGRGEKAYDHVIRGLLTMPEFGYHSPFYTHLILYDMV